VHARPLLRRDPAVDHRGRLAIVAGENRLDPGRLHGRLHRNRRKGGGRNRHRRGYCLTLRGQQQHEADAGHRCGRRDSREPGRHSRRHVSESRPCRPYAEGPGHGHAVRSSPGVLQAARGEDPRAHIVHLESGDPQRRRGGQCGVAVHPHRFRHHFSHTWLDRSGPEGDLMELNGWASPQMLRRYGASARSARARAPTTAS
jgi:hypothetical protein